MRATSPSQPRWQSPFESRAGILGRELIRAGRFLKLLVPQTAASGVFIGLYGWLLKLPLALAGVHVLLIATNLAVFFLFSAVFARGVPNARRWMVHTHAGLCLAAWLCINPLYFANLAVNHAWGGNLRLDAVPTLLPHLNGLRIAFGPVVYAAAAGILLVVAVCASVVQRRATARWHALQRVVARPPAEPSSRWLVAPACMTLALAMFACGWITRQPQLLRRDPVFAFWLGLRPSASLVDPVADQAARAAYPQIRSFRPANVMIFVVDCLRADRTPLHGYGRDTTPFLRGLAANGRLHAVDFALSEGNNSPQGVFAILASRHTQYQGPSNFTFTEILKRHGYRTHMIGAGDHTSFEQMRQSYGNAWDVFVDGFRTERYSINDDRLILDALDALPPSDGTPAFFHFHLMSVHTLSVRNARFARWQPAVHGLGHGFAWTRFVAGRTEREYATNTYDNGVLQADDTIRRIFAVLERKGYLGDYVAAITGDHGEGLGEHGHFGHTRFLHQEDTHVPLFFVDSDPAPFGSMPLGTLVDIAPTLLHRLRLPAPPTWEGLALGRPPARTIAWLTGSRENSWRGFVRLESGEIQKYLFATGRNGGVEEHLYNLLADPHEEKNLIAEAPAAQLAELRRLASARFHTSIPPP